MANKTSIDNIIAKIDELINAISGLTSSDKHENYEKQEKKKQQEKLLEEARKFGLTKMELLKKDQEKELKLFDEGSIERKEIEEKHKKELQKIIEEEKNIKEKHAKEIHKRLVESNNDELELLDIKLQEELEQIQDNEDAKIELENLYSKKRNEILEKNFKEGLKNFTSGFQSLYQIAKKVENDIQNSYGKADQEAVNYGRAIGLNAREVHRLRSEMSNFMSDGEMALKYNMSTEESIKLVGSYTKEMGRAVRLTNEQTENLLGMNRLMGEDKSAKFAANFEKFGLNVDAAAKISSELFGEAGRRGISFEKISNNFLDNIELAQQYTFENGIEGLKKMAINAAEVKWNMQQTASFAEKVSTVEGAIKTGAQLSVLGGPFAQFSNPMGMLYESLNDMEGLQDRILTMFGGLGEWDNKKNQVDISAFNRQRIKAAASAMGLNYNDVINTVNQQARRKQILNNIKGLKLDEDTEKLIANTGQLDEKGKVFVTIGGQKKYVKDGLNEKDKNALIEKTKTKDEDIKNIAQTTKSLLEHQQSVEKERINKLTQMIENTGIGDKMRDIYNILGKLQNYILIIQGATLSIQAITAAYKIGGGIHNVIANRKGITPIISNTLNRGKGSIFNLANNKAASVAAGTGVSIASFIGSAMMSNQQEKLMENGNYEDAQYVGMGAGALQGITALAPIGSMIGGLPGLLIGTGLGAIGGGIYGWANAGNEIKEVEKQNEIIRKKEYIYNKHGIILNGEYEPYELDTLKLGSNHWGNKLYEKFMRYDGDKFNGFPKESFAKGGIVNGDTHANGGAVIEAEKNEFVVNAKSSENNLSLLKKINDNPFKPLQPMGEQLLVETKNVDDYKHYMGFDDLKISMNGGLQVSLVGGQTQNIDTSELLSNPVFIRGIRDEIIKQINYTTDKTFNKDKYYRKL